MKIQYMSDLHMEFAENSRYIKHNEFPVTGEVLVLAGDTFYLNNTVAPLSKFWKWASANYRQVLLVPGNHEYYQFCDVMERGLQWKWMFKDNVGVYQNHVVRIDDTNFILSTLWSNIPAQDEYFVWKGLNDFRLTKYKGKLIQVNEYNQLHQFCLDFIKKSVAESTAEKSLWLPTICRHGRWWHHSIRTRSPTVPSLRNWVTSLPTAVSMYGYMVIPIPI